MILALLIACLAVPLGAASVAPAAAQGAVPRAALRPVEVTVTVRSACEPLPGVSLQVLSPPNRGGAGVTDEQGRTTVAVAVPAGASRIAVSLGAREPLAGETQAEWRALVDRMMEYRRRYLFERQYLVEIGPETTQASLSITVERSIKARLRVLEDGAPLEGSAGSARSPIGERPAPDGSMTVGGPAPSTPWEVYVRSHSTARVYVIPVPASADDIELGEVAVASGTPDSEVRLTMTHRDGFDPLGFDKAGGVALISTDGSRVYGFLSDHTGRAWREPYKSPPDPTRVTAGTYYVMPGYFGATPAQVAVLRAARGGVDLTATGVPRIVASRDAAASLEFDGPAAVRAALGLGPPPAR